MINSTNYEIQIVEKFNNGEDPYGNKVTTENIITKKVLLAWGSGSNEYTPQRDTSIITATLFLPGEFEVAETTEFIIDGERYKQKADVQKWKAPSGFSLIAGNVVEIEMVEG